MTFKISAKLADVADTATGDYMNHSGIYDCVINFANIAVSKNGAQSINFNCEYNGNPVTLYGPYITDREGNPLEIGMKLLNKLGIIAGMEDGDELDIQEEEHAVGKDNKVQTFSVITNFSGLPVMIRLQEEYSINPNTKEIRKSMVIKNFFREDGASAEEIVAGKDFGKRLALEKERYANNVTYRDGLTAEAVEEWRKSRNKANVSKEEAPKKPAVKAPTSGLFGARKS